MKKIIKFLDKHRFILVLLILVLISFLFIGINSFIFLHNKFNNLNCTDKLDETYCYHNNKQIYIDPINEKEKFFKEKKEEIEALVKKYKLPKYNFYTSYYYEVAALFNFNETDENEDLLLFFKCYNDTFNISEFYKKNTLYYDMFYPYKII